MAEDANRVLKKRITKLKKELSQVKKQNHKLNTMIQQFLSGEIEDIEFVVDDNDKEAIPTMKNQMSCPSCSSRVITEFTLRDQNYYKCAECGSKGKSVRSAV